VLQLAEEAESRVTRGAQAAHSGLAELYSGKAQCLALAGRHAEAVSALEQARETFADLPSTTANDHDSLFGWAEERMRFTESFVFSHLGDLERADEAQRRALALYPASHPRGPAQIELQRAFCLVRGGDVTSGARHAVDTMARLPREHYDLPVADLGHQVLDAVPASERRRAGVTELGECLALV
jgi:tetratricopeptide (TPR) repeat protein